VKLIDTRQERRVDIWVGLNGQFVNFCGLSLFRGIGRICRRNAFDAGSGKDLVLFSQLDVNDCSKGVATRNM
jgi:hypothetical protein